MYRYRALKSGHIRIATLRPGLFEDDVSVILREEKFQPPRHMSQYEALSYAWDEQGTTTAWVLLATAAESAANQVTRVTATRNLDLALRHLRYSERNRDLWIDKLCIDQQNTQEKGPQVKMMGEIYSLATQVLVFLGPVQDQSPRAMGLLEEIGSQVDWDPVSCTISPAEKAHDKTIGDMKVDLPYDADEMTCLFHLLCQKWFTRLWVRQEVLLAATAVAICGFQTLPWPVFQRGLACLYLKGHRTFPFEDDFALRLDMTRTLLFGRAGVTLNTLRRDFSMLQCQDPRDRVFAVLSLIRCSFPSLHIDPDYEKSSAKVYEEFVTEYLHHAASIGFLIACSFNEASQAPSWVPDWSRVVRARLDTRIWSSSSMFASGHFAPSVSVLKDSRLSLMGVRLGVIQKIQQVPLEVTIEEVRDLVHDLMRNESLDDIYFGGGTILEAYTRSVCMNAFAENFRPPLMHLPSLKPSTHLMRQIASYDMDSDKSEPILAFLAKARSTLAGRCFYKTRGGGIGIGPSTIKVNDILYVGLGSDLPLVTRRVSVNEHWFIGTCYMCGVERGEALLGFLPQHIRMVHNLEEPRHGQHQKLRRGFLDTKSDLFSTADPRLAAWPIDHKLYQDRVDRGEESFLKIDHDIFEDKGVSVCQLLMI